MVVWIVVVSNVVGTALEILDYIVRMNTKYSFLVVVLAMVLRCLSRQTPSALEQKLVESDICVSTSSHSLQRIGIRYRCGTQPVPCSTNSSPYSLFHTSVAVYVDSLKADSKT